MNKEAHFFDLDYTLWQLNNNGWIIDKSSPDIPLIKLNGNELIMLKSGVYKKDNLKISYNDQTYFLSNELMNKIQKKKNIPIDRIGISLIEFIDPTYFEHADFKILLKNIQHLKGNKNADIILLTARANRGKHQILLNKLREVLRDELGLSIFKIFFISDSFQLNNNDLISWRKLEIMMEHLIGVKIENRKFVPITEDKYDIVHLYDDQKANIDTARNIQEFFELVYRKTTDSEVKQYIINRLTSNVKLFLHLVGSNDIYRFTTEEISLKEPTRYPIYVKENRIIPYNKFK